MKKTGKIGYSFDHFLKQDGIYEQVTARAIKRVIASTRCADAGSEFDEIESGETDADQPGALDRPLDPDNESVTLGTLTRAAQAVGRQLRMELV
jgi:antitoxin HicB